MPEALELTGNASSVHAAGRAARGRIETGARRGRSFLNADRERLVFTSGGVEADNLAVASAVAAGLAAADHRARPSTPASASQPRPAKPPSRSWPVDGDGLADLDWLCERLARWDAADGRPFVALMLANNETGVIQPISKAAEIVREAGGWLHVDAVAGRRQAGARHRAARRRQPRPLRPQDRRAAGHRAALAWSERVHARAPDARRRARAGLPLRHREHRRASPASRRRREACARDLPHAHRPSRMARRRRRPAQGRRRPHRRGGGAAHCSTL